VGGEDHPFHQEEVFHIPVEMDLEGEGVEQTFRTHISLIRISLILILQ